MIIQSANVNTASQGSHSKTTTQSTVLVGSDGRSASAAAITFQSRERLDYLEINQTSSQSNTGAQLGQKADMNGGQEELLITDDSGRRSGLFVTDNSTEPFGSIAMDKEQMKLDMLMRMISAMSGKKYELQRLTMDSKLSTVTNGSESFVRSSSSSSSERFSLSISFLNDIRGGMRAALNGNGNMLSIVRQESTVETESFSYSANGSVKTADGKTIDFNIDLSMSRTAESYLSETIGFTPAPQQRAIDPLVINYAGTAASLTDEKYEFDLDVDGVKDMISFAGQGSGFLALDKNGDGVINDGNELFGPQTGNGFEELRKYDSDGNGWIDEADEVYSKLKVWTKDANGNDVLYSLKELDVGAIYLNENKTQFGMYDSHGNAQGVMQSTSFFLKDSGGGGTISHFDLLV